MSAPEENLPTPIDWPAHIAAWRESGLPMNRYCQQQDLATHQLGYYKRKFEAINQPSEENTGSGFSRVSVSTAIATESLTLRFPSGLAIEGISSHNALLATSLARALL